MSARAGCDVRAAGRPASTVNLPDCLRRKHVPLYVRLFLSLSFASLHQVPRVPFWPHSFFRPTKFLIRVDILKTDTGGFKLNRCNEHFISWQLTSIKFISNNRDTEIKCLIMKLAVFLFKVHTMTLITSY